MPTMQPPAPDTLARAIREMTDAYVDGGRAVDAYAINDGLCAEFARDVEEVMGGETGRFHLVDAAGFTVEGEGEEWDVALIEGHWPASAPTHGLCWDDVRYEIPSHTWIVLEGRHYDAECPDGTENLFEMPLIRRGMEAIAARKAAPSP